MADEITNLFNPVICYGEVLWDMLPDGPQIGGAPLNVAYHLSKLNVKSSIISKVGNDLSGYKISSIFDKWGLDKSYLQVDEEHSTSKVLVKLNERNDAQYEILYPVAWDFINPVYAFPSGITNAHYLIYGSLSSRNETSKATLFNMLDHDLIKVLDVNMRDPYVKKADLEYLLTRADIVKANREELKRISLLFGGCYESEKDKVNFLVDKFNIAEVIITKGANGASYFIDGGCFSTTSPQIRVADTIGSGDAFLAAFIAGRHSGHNPQTTLYNSIAMGAFISTKKGGCPEYEIKDFETFKTKSKTKSNNLKTN
ncbi:carbohydrate kinase [Mucilaginibacter sp.]|jgi:fructokinase|uniref:carbohydrate kinase family protein n=1 Tax=Mucilaginibacter sp. TaxID=1882438 RepID=UPI003562CD5F